MRPTTTAMARMSRAPWRGRGQRPGRGRGARGLDLPSRCSTPRARAATSTSPPGIVWAADHGARIVNLSLGGREPSSVLADAVAYARGKEVLVVAAAGNDGGDGGRARPPRGECSRWEPSMPRSCVHRSVPAAARSISSPRASASCSRRWTAPAGMPIAPSRGHRWPRLTSQASRRSRSRRDGRPRRSASRACSPGRRAISACGPGRGLRRRPRAGGRRSRRGGGTLKGMASRAPPIRRSHGRSGCSGSTHPRARRRSAAPGRSASRARTPTATPSARTPPRA